MFAPVRRAYSVVEVLVAATLAIGLGAMVSLAISSSSTASRDAVARANAAEEVRQINDVVSRYIKGAVPDRDCTLPSSAITTLAGCVVVKDNVALLRSASASSIEFLAYPDGPSAAPPNMVQVTAIREPDNAVSLTVAEFAPSSPDYFTPAYPAVPSNTLRRSTLVSPKLAGLCTTSLPDPTKVFSFYDAQGNQLSALPLSASDLEKVTVIAFDPQVRVPVRNEPCPRLVASSIMIGLPVKGFGR